MPGLPSWAQVGAERRSHIDRVAGLIESWADAMRIPPAERDRWMRAAYLHDALRDAPQAELESLAGNLTVSDDLLHGPAAAEMARRQGERDNGVLDAVRYHSVGFAGWDSAGRILYLADYLEPGRRFRQAERRAMAERVPAETVTVLREVAAERLRWLVDSGWTLPSETVGFWNGLVGGS